MAAVQDPEQLSISAAKSAPANTYVLCDGYVSAIYSGCFYIESGDRSSGIRVQMSGYTPTLGQDIAVTGYTAALASTEVYINATNITPTGSPNQVITPLGMTNIALYGTGLTNGGGLNCSGLLVTVWGQVTSVNGNQYTISDGSSSPATIGSMSGSLTTGSFVAVTGAVSCFTNGSATQPLVLVSGISNVNSFH